MAAIALNSSTESKSATRRDLLDIHEEAATEEIKENLLRARFLGVTVGILYISLLSLIRRHQSVRLEDIPCVKAFSD